MAVVHRFQGQWGQHFEWQGARSHAYTSDDSSCGATETWLIGKAENARNFALRYYELEPGGHSRDEQHPYDHGVVFLRGEGDVILSGERHHVGEGDVVYIPPDERHQIVNRGEGPLGWLCVIPAHRRKMGHDVWAEEGQEDLTTT